LIYRRVSLDPLCSVRAFSVRLSIEEIGHHNVVSSFTNFVGNFPLFPRARVKA
jgi:hypothetical protein